MKLKTKMQLNLGVFMLIAGYMISHEFQTIYAPHIAEWLTLKM